MILAIDTQKSQPIYEQLRDQIVLGIAAKQLAPLERLPSVRQMASDLGINLHTVNKAYSLLCGEGYIVMDRQKGAVVAVLSAADEKALQKISENLMLSAAEARCKNIGEEDFLAICRKCYREIDMSSQTSANPENGI